MMRQNNGEAEKGRDEGQRAAGMGTLFRKA